MGPSRRSAPSVRRREPTSLCLDVGERAPTGTLRFDDRGVTRCGRGGASHRAFDPKSYSLGAGELRRLLSDASLREVVVESVELDAVWRNAEDAVATVTGTPYGPSVGAFPVEGQQRVRGLLAPRLTQSPGGTVTIRTTSHVVRRVKQPP